MNDEKVHTILSLYTVEIHTTYTCISGHKMGPRLPTRL